MSSHPPSSSSSDDAIDTNLRDLAVETAQEVSIQTQELSEEVEKSLYNADGDPCNSFDWSVIFLLVFVLSFAVMFVHAWALWKRRGAGLSAFDVVTVALFASTIIQFGPMMSQVLHSGHGVYHFSQSGCKILFYTDYGMRHVITFLVSSLLGYAYLVLFHSFDPENLDGKLKGNLAWFVLLLLGIEALFGMPAAVYVDVGPENLQSCVWTATMTLTLQQIVALEMIMRPLTPYLIPMVLLAYPMVRVTRTMKTLDPQAKVKPTLYCCMVLVWGYFAMNLPYALLLIIESAGHITEARNFSWVTVCNFKWAFFLLHQAWFLLLPISVVALEAEKGNKPPGSELVAKTWNNAKRQFNTRVRMF